MSRKKILCFILTVLLCLPCMMLAVTAETDSLFAYNTDADINILEAEEFAECLSENIMLNQVSVNEDIPAGISYYIPLYFTDADPTSGISGYSWNSCTDYTMLTGNMETLNSGWYYVQGEFTFDHYTVNGDVKLILGEYCSISGKYITVNQGNSLTIYSENENTKKNACGKVVLNAYDSYLLSSYRGYACIGGSTSQTCGTITINGGVYEITRSKDGSGIGGGEDGDGNNITLNNCTVTFTDDSSTNGEGACIGGGDGGSASHICINSSYVCADDNTRARGGIGGGDNGDASYIYINNSTVTMIVNSDFSNGGSEVNCAGIGSGVDRDASHIYIKNSTVTAKGGYEGGAGIGAGEGGSASDIYIYNSNVHAYGGSNGGAAIGGGEVHNGGARGSYITIENSTVEAYGSDGAAGIGGGQDGIGEYITIINSTVLSCGGSDGGAGIGGGEECEGMHITIQDSTVTAYGGDGAAAIGAGRGQTGCYIDIENSIVKAYGKGEGAGIGGGEDGWGNYITIKGDDSNILAIGGDEGAGIGGGATASGVGISILSGKVKAQGGEGASGIGNGADPDSNSSEITVSTTRKIRADGNYYPRTLISNNGGDLANSFSGRRYVLIEKASSTVAGSIFDGMNIWIIVGLVVVFAAVAVVTVVVVKKKKKTQTQN